MATRETITTILAYLYEAFPQMPEPSPERAKVWEDAFSDIANDAMLSAVRQLARSWTPEYGRTSPSIAEIRAEACGRSKLVGFGPEEMREYEADVKRATNPARALPAMSEEGEMAHRMKLREAWDRVKADFVKRLDEMELADPEQESRIAAQIAELKGEASSETGKQPEAPPASVQTP